MNHLGQIRQAVLEKLESRVQTEPTIERALLAPDVFARMRVALWLKRKPTKKWWQDLKAEFAQLAGPFWGGLWLFAKPNLSNVDRRVLDTLWEEARPHTDKIRIHESTRSLTVWLQPLLSPPWEVDPSWRTRERPPIVSFYAFKGGMGRSTALAIFAAQRAHAGERVAVIDLDLAAPGVGRLLLKPNEMPAYGVVDYWLERPLVNGALRLSDYYARVSSPAVAGRGEIFVFPAGRFDEDYLLKLSRLDFLPPEEGKHPQVLLLEQIRDELKPDWILLDARAGLSEAAGFAFGGLAHLNVLFGGTTAASWDGLRLAIRRLGAERIARGLPQAECVLVHGLVPDNPALAQLAETEFLKNAQEAFEQLYYKKDPPSPDLDESAKDEFWYLSDSEEETAPHKPVSIRYSSQIAYYSQFEFVVAHGLQSEDYRKLGSRILSFFPEEAAVGREEYEGNVPDRFQRQEAPAMQAKPTSQTTDRQHLLQRVADMRLFAEDEEEFRTAFYPVPEHLRVFEPNVYLIIGYHGAGKTALFKAAVGGILGSSQITRKRISGVAWDRTEWLAGFPLEQDLPSLTALRAAANKLEGDSFELAKIWLAYLVHVLKSQPELNQFRDIVQASANEPLKVHEALSQAYDQVVNALDELDNRLQKEDKWCFISYDAVDLLYLEDKEFGQRALRSLLLLWIDQMRRWRRLQPKIFIRTDLYRAVDIQAADFAILSSKRAELCWDGKDLYTMLAKRLANLRGCLTIRCKGEQSHVGAQALPNRPH